MQAQEDEFYMRMALDEACAAAREGEVPIGAVVVYEAAHDPASDAYISPEDPKGAWEQAPPPRVLARAHTRREFRWTRHVCRRVALGSPVWARAAAQ